MPGYRVGAVHLPPAEVMLIRTLMRLFSHDQSFRWEFAEKAPFDALIIDGSAPATLVESASQHARAVLTLTRTSEQENPNQLARPLRADRLQAWLQRVQDEVMETRMMTAFAESESPEPDPTADDHQSYKLKRWPPLTLLHKDPVRIRMATMLSRRHLKISELASMTSLDRQEIYPFVHKLQMVGLLEVRQEAPPAPRKPATADVAAPTPSASPASSSKPTFGKGLILSIRKRFGL